ncbi:MAG: hypothetical protein IJ033_05715 [Clostridia bacterium]|nr:hypothetical protein [Clostridia bacterium]
MKKKQKIKAELWDKMQYLFRNYYDRMVHAVLYYDGLIDIPTLKTILVGTTEKVPVLHSSFHDSAIDPYWVVEPYVVDDILTIKEVDKDALEEEIESFITQCIPVESHVQFKMAIFNSEGKSTLCMIVNHMCFDGGDFKYFLKRLARNYNSAISGTPVIDIKTGTRSYDQVYTKLDDEDKEVAKNLYKNISQVKDEHYFPLTPDHPSDKSMINRSKVDRETFDKFRRIGKHYGVTVNDLMLAVYMHSLYEFGGYPETDTVTIPCMVDLRRHIEGGEEAGGLTNHTGFMQCSVEGVGANVNETLVKVLQSVRKSKQDKYMGLYSLPLLKLAYTILPYAISEIAIKIGYLNPLIGMSNIGVLDPVALSLNGLNLVDGFMTGAVKYKPYMQLALTSLNGELTMTIAIRGNDEDKKAVERFFEIIHRNIADFIEHNKQYAE